jgi:hypothetical protein
LAVHGVFGFFLGASRLPSAARRLPPNCARWRADFRVFFDVAAEEPVGRLVFKVSEEAQGLSKTIENFKVLVAGDRRILDPALTFRGCTFVYGPQYGEETQLSTQASFQKVAR